MEDTALHGAKRDAVIVKLERKDLGLSAVSMKELLESGVHFGHQTRRWNPQMKPYIFTERGGIYIIDLQKTTKLIDEAFDFVKGLATNGKKTLFVGTKKQCQDTIADEAKRAEMPFVSHRWLGGLLTNYATISKRIKRMHELRRLKEEGQLELLPTKEQMNLLSELDKLEVNLGGVSDMDKLPDAVFVIDTRREAIVIREARKLGIPIVALVDTNCDPNEVDYVIPGNDDAIRSCGLIIRAIAEAVIEGKQLLSERELKAGMAAAEEARKNAEAKSEMKAAASAGDDKAAVAVAKKPGKKAADKTEAAAAPGEKAVEKDAPSAEKDNSEEKDSGGEAAESSSVDEEKEETAGESGQTDAIEENSEVESGN